MLSIEEYKAVFDAAPDGYVVVASDGTIRAVNPRVEQMFGWTADELEGSPVEVLLPGELRGTHVGHRSDFGENPRNRPMGAGLDLRAERKDGSRFPVEVSLSPWRRDEGDVQVICSVRDVSEVRRLQNFSEGALRASEDERQRIARELHDDTAQRLATLILRVRQICLEADDDRRSDLFDSVRQEIVDAADGVRRMARGLRPPEIEELGLALALQAHGRTLREAGDVSVEMEISEVDEHLDETAKLAVYRIVQEALSNVRRHSGVQEATVTVFVKDGAVVVEVCDAGTGFDPSGVTERPRGLGLIGMQERATMIGGRLTVSNPPRGGTRVRLVVPIDDRASTRIPGNG